MKFSVWPDMSYPPSEVLALARWADAHDFFGVWYADHYMVNTGDRSFAPGDAHECWAMLPAIAAVTKRVRLGSLVAPTSVHHPAVLANRAATIDHLSRAAAWCWASAPVGRSTNTTRTASRSEPPGAASHQIRRSDSDHAIDALKRPHLLRRFGVSTRRRPV